MKTYLKNENTDRGLQLSYITFVIYLAILLIIFLTNANGQGLINNGANLSINGSFITIAGGVSTGNFTNQDDGGLSGTIENTGVIEVSGDWINNSAQNVFSSNTGTVNFTGTSQSIAGSTTTYFNDLSFSSTGVKILNINTLAGGGFTAPAGILSLGNSNLDLNTYMLTVNNSSPSAVTRASGYIISETNAAFNPSIVQWNAGSVTGSYEFPFGSANGYTPVTVVKNDPTPSDLSVSTRATSAADNQPWASGVTQMYSPVIAGPGEVPVVIDRWYYVRASSPVNVDLQFTYSGIENTTTYSPTGTFGAENWKGYWGFPAGSGPGVTTGTATVTAASQIIGPLNNNWVLANILAPLPIQLLSFDAWCNGEKKVLVNWTTASEQEVDHFSIQRSSDGVNFQTLAVIPSQGSISKGKNYEWYDVHPSPVIAYYRLAENDINGKVTIFKPLAVEVCKGSTNEQQIYSAASTIYFNVNTDADDQCIVQIFDALGKIVMNEKHLLQHGYNSFQIKTVLSTGVYFVQCTVGNSITTKKVVLNN